MLQQFEGTIENGQLIWKDPINAPKQAKVIITVLPVEKKVVLKVGERLSDRFEDAMIHLSKEEKKQRDKELKGLRNEWERRI